MKVGLAAQTGEAGPGGTQGVPPRAKPPPTLAEVAQLFPQLEMLECLGCGGMGAVYKARQPRLDRLVALKILTHDREDATRDARFAERFEREARALAKLSHPNIVAMYEFGQAGGLPYFIMEYVDGLNLRQLEQAGKLAPRQALQIIPQICEALQFAHDAGIVHRDIKPENILLDKKGRVKIADFGIAKIVGGTPFIASDAEKLAIKPGEGLTQDQILGTPHYMAPEQREHPQTVDHRADIYSLGVVFYEILTGELPLGKFEPPSRKVLIDVRLDEIVLHALDREPERRYQHASEVKTDLETLGSTAAPAASSKAAAGEPAQPERVKNALRLVRWPATGLMAIGLSFLVVAGCFFAFGHRPANWPDALVFCCMGMIDYVILLGSWKMRRLQNYRLAVLAAIVSLVVALPGFALAAFPIWALMVLYRPDVRAAFDDVARKGASEPAATPASTSSASVPRPGAPWKTVIGIAAVVMVLIIFLLAIVVPSLQRAPSAASAFGPEREVSLSSLGIQAGDCFLDLDEGRIVRPPGPYSGWLRERKHEWLRQNGIDLMIMGSAIQSWSLLTPVDNETKLTKVPARTWEQGLDPDAGARQPESAEAIQFLNEGVELLQVRLDGRPTHPDHTFAFQTANGARGVMKVSGLNLGAGDEIVGLKLRFKKFQASAESTRNDLPPAMTPRPEAVVFGPVTTAQSSLPICRARPLWPGNTDTSIE